MTQERQKMTDAPVTYKKDEDGNVIYPRTEDGHAGGAFTPYQRDVESVRPAPAVEEDATRVLEAASVVQAQKVAPDAAQDFESADKNTAPEARTAANDARPHRAPVNLPPNVEVRSEGGVHSYVFIASEAGRQAGFAPSTPLGTDEGGEGAGPVAEKAWALAGEMAAAIKAHEDKLQGHEKTQGLPGDGHADMAPTAGALHAVGTYPGSDEALMQEFRRAEDEAYYREADRIAAHETALDPGHASEVVGNIPIVPPVEVVKPARAAGKRRRARKTEPAPEAPAPD